MIRDNQILIIHKVPTPGTFASQDRSLEIILALLVVFVVVGLIMQAGKPTKQQVRTQSNIDQMRPLRVKWLLDEGVSGPILSQASDGHVLGQGSKGQAYLFRPSYTSGMLLDHASVIGVDVVEDGITVTPAGRGRQIGSAIVGGAIAGRAGAVIGGLGTSKTSQEHVNKVLLRLSLNDARWSLIEITFLDAPGSGLPKNNPAYLKARTDAFGWCAKIESAVRASSETVAPVTTTPSGDPTATPTQGTQNNLSGSSDNDLLGKLERLIKMKEAGHLSESEFEAQKNIILGRDS